MKCQFCNQELPDGAKFCHKCFRQIVCLGCGELLIENSSICVYCGKEIKVPSAQANVNHIKYSETENGKSFEASFSDETAGNVVDVFARFLPLKRNNDLQQHQHVLQLSQAEEANAEEIRDTLGDNKVVNLNNKYANKINSIFAVKGDSIMLYEKRLKAKSKSDHQARICLLYLLYIKQTAKKEVNREDLKGIMEKENLYDGNFRAWFSQHKSYFIINDDAIELSPEGEEKAQGILSEVMDKSVENLWSPNSGNQPSTTKVSSKHRNPQVVKELNLCPKDKESLDDFMKHYKYGKSSPRIILLFVYYLKQVLCGDNVNQNHIFTCFRHTKLTIPNNLYTCISDVIRKKGWIENISNLNVTTQGINEVEQKMRIK